MQIWAIANFLLDQLEFRKFWEITVSTNKLVLKLLQVFEVEPKFHYYIEIGFKIVKVYSSQLNSKNTWLIDTISLIEAT